ncbi:neural cell adhesion molecule 1-like [Petromyzon marinus]|uniref:neural cell adhesion molecule 1-like n=1 Tax=Petromyzon marinus TaxID=7757 RepID=UPI003F730696
MANGVCRGNYSDGVIFTTRAELAPSPPNISQRPGEPQVVSLSVEDDGGLPVTGYTVRYRPVSQDGATAMGPWREVRGGPHGEVRLVGLRARTRYQAMAYAENAEGRSPGSEFGFKSAEEERWNPDAKQWLWLLLLAPALMLVADVSCCVSRRRGVTAQVGRSLCRGRGDSGQRDKVTNSLFVAVGRNEVAEKNSEPLANIEVAHDDRGPNSTPSPPPSPTPSSPPPSPPPSPPSPPSPPPHSTPSLSPTTLSPPTQTPTFSSFQ